MAGGFVLAKRAPWIFTGLALTALGLGLDSLGLGGSPGIGVTQMECLALGILVTIVSAMPFPPSYTFVWAARALLILVTLAVSVELASMAVLRFGGGSARTVVGGEAAAFVPDPEFDFAPFVTWRTRPGFSDGMASVDCMGIRNTSAPETDSEDAFLIVLLGGSSVWGWGVPDSGTVASHLQEDLDALLAGPVRVVNLAQPGWTVTQQVIGLMLEIRAGSRPDLVILSVGLHDAAAAAAGSREDPRWLDRAATAWNGRAGDARASARAVLEASSAFALFAPLLGLAGTDQPFEGAASAILPLPSGEPDSAAGRMAADVVGAVKVARSIAGSCDARCALVLCPCWPVSSRRPSPEERDLLLPAMDSTAGAVFVREAWQALRNEAGSSSWFLDLSSSLDSVPGHLYYGPDCLTSLGNDVLASAMVDQIASKGLLW